ncbi:protection of telomeres protein 1 isoform X2 [Syngnathus scovelli]|uniref:protection of telomeres protein 1 isoform X2 n=1 Tax=Syngnathus scovelli TaxID=161590 RepID=UPI002110B7F3|nr:protection of telomeres protein 1 isoform X2 [Syngnathus scovelli]
MSSELQIDSFLFLSQPAGSSPLHSTSQEATAATRMPVILLAEGAGPGNLTIVPIAHINVAANHSHHSVKGRVVHKGQLLASSRHNFSLKTIIEDDSGPREVSSINVVLLDKLASDFYPAVNQGDEVTLSGFSVRDCPTAEMGRQHPCVLEMLGDRAFVHVSWSPPTDLSAPQQAQKNDGPATSSASRIPPADLPAPRQAQKNSGPATPSVSSEPKRAYVKLGDLKPGDVVNVYGVVVFFKRPFKSRGTDYCSSLKITDQSQKLISCTIFCPTLESHPQIFQNGDIVRLHKVKTKLYKGSLALISSFGFSAMTFSGKEGDDFEPQTSSRTSSFTEDDYQNVKALRSWAADQDLLHPDPGVPLSGVQPEMYFNLTCQLLAKAPVDSTCTLLRVWDGSRCPHALLQVTVDPDVTEGPAYFSEEQEMLIANVLVYDNHVECARRLKPGDFLRIFNLRAVPGSVKVPKQSGGGRVEEVNLLAFHLHGGTAYGRGLCALPDNNPDVPKLKRAMELFHAANQVNDSAMMEVDDAPPHPAGGASMEFGTVRRCAHEVAPITLGELLRREPGGFHHVRAQLASYEPQRLHQALKLYCSKCNAMEEVPNDLHVESVLSGESGQPSGPYVRPFWCFSGSTYIPAAAAADDEPGGASKRLIRFYQSALLVLERRPKEFILFAGYMLHELRRMAAKYLNVVPVSCAPDGRLALLDLSAPFLLCGRKSFYGCKRCSKEPAIMDPTLQGSKVINERDIAKAFGIQLLKLVLVLKFRLQDGDDTLDAFLWKDAETFFNVSAEDAAINQQAQAQIRQTLDSLCPPEGATGERPWLDLCVASYSESDADADGKAETFYQVCHTSARTSSPLT